MKQCENCDIEHDGTYGSGRFCSIKCSKGFSTKAKRKEINEKIRLTLTKEPLVKVCEKCGEAFNVKYSKRNQKCCSTSCSISLRGGWNVVHNKLSKNEWSVINKKSYQNGNNYVAGGTTKWHIYKDIKVQGTYELRTCRILDNWKDKGIIKNWEYTNDKIQYTAIDGKKHSYLLDFKIFTNENDFYYLETKGFERPNDKLKWNEVKNQGYKLVIWFDNDIKEQENNRGEVFG